MCVFFFIDYASIFGFEGNIFFIIIFLAIFIKYNILRGEDEKEVKSEIYK